MELHLTWLYAEVIKVVRKTTQVEVEVAAQKYAKVVEAFLRST